MPLSRRRFLSVTFASFAMRGHADGTPIVAAAASLRGVLPGLIKSFKAATGFRLRVAFGSSGTLAQQIRHGAPFALFMSADERYVADLARDRFLRHDGVVYAQGRLALIAPTGGVLKVDPGLKGLRSAMDKGDITRFAIANPGHAPYGQRAREALLGAGLWERLEPRLVIGENVAQATQFAVSGNAHGGLVAASLALQDAVLARSTHALIPTETHTPLRQRMALTPMADAVAETFYDFLQTPDAHAHFARHGFAAPGST